MSPEYKKQALQYLSSNIKNGGFSFKIFPCDLIPNDHCDFRITEYSRDVFRVNQPGNLEFPRKFGLELKAFRPRYQSLSNPQIYSIFPEFWGAVPHHNTNFDTSIKTTCRHRGCTFAVVEESSTNIRQATLGPINFSTVDKFHHVIRSLV